MSGFIFDEPPNEVSLTLSLISIDWWKEWKGNDYCGEDIVRRKHPIYDRRLQPTSWFPAPACRFTNSDSMWSGSESVISSSPPQTQTQTQLDVVSLLSSKSRSNTLIRNGETESVEFDAVIGKYLLILCVSLPLDTKSADSNFVRSLIESYPYLSDFNFEILIVVSDTCQSETLFNDFLSAFPPCLAIPFTENKSRDFVASRMGFTSVLINPHGIIVMTSSIKKTFVKFGVELFPFSDSRLKALETEDHILRSRLDPLYEIPGVIFEVPHARDTLSLHNDILLCNPDLKLYQVSHPGQDDLSLTVSDLSNTLVGLYFCYDGYLMERLSKVHQHCIANKKELHIVLVCLPLFDHTVSYHQELKLALRRFDTQSWFVFPYDSKATRRLWRVFGQGRQSDSLVIIPPNCKSGELKGHDVITKFRLARYPFTRSGIKEERFNTLRSITPASLFKGTDEDHTCLYYLKGPNAGSRVPHSALKGKMLLLYLDFLDISQDCGHLCSLLMEHYPELQAMGCEVVFIPMDAEYAEAYHQHCASEMPWMMMPIHDAAFVSEQLLVVEDGELQHVIVIGKDGRTLSTQAEKLLLEGHTADALFSDNLCQEISDLCFELDF